MFQDQFYQKDLEGLYRKYDDKLRETLIYIYVLLLTLFSTTHLVVVFATTHEQVSYRLGLCGYFSFMIIALDYSKIIFFFSPQNNLIDV